MTKILQGDTSSPISIALAEGYDYTSAVVEIEFCGVTRRFTDAHGGDTLQLRFAAYETARFPLGAFPLTVRIVTGGNTVTVRNSSVKIAVTDIPEEVHGGDAIGVDVTGGLFGIEDLPAHYTDKDVVAKLREILRRGGAMLSLMLCAFGAFGAGIELETRAKEDLYNDDQIVIGATLDTTGLAETANTYTKGETDERIQTAITEAGAVTPGTVTNIVNGMAAGLVTEESDPTVPAWAKADNPPAETDPSVPDWAKADDPPEETDPTVPAWAKNPTPPVTTESDPVYSADKASLQTSINSKVAAQSGYAYSLHIGSGMSGDLLTLNNINLSTPTTIKHVKAGSTYNLTVPTSSGTLALVSDIPNIDSTLTEDGSAADAYTVGERLGDLSTTANDALLYASGVYQYMTGNTNAWFSGTNYVTTADSTNRTHFVWEDGMDVLTVPCSMALWEIREGERKTVWDQRDWTVWYWNFKANQMSNALASVTSELAENVRTNGMTRGWSKYTAVRGLDNPDPSTLWVDTANVQLMAGHQWEKIVEIGGAGYWTLTGNGIELAADEAEETFLNIKDFEGNAVLTFRKTSSYLALLETGTDIVSSFVDDQHRVCFHITTDVQPTAEFSTTLDIDSFVAQDDDGCPANYEWTGSAGNWDCHFLLKPGIVANACFARFKVLREGENVVEHSVPIKMNGGIIFDQGGVSYKIKPTISGTTVNWVIVQ